MTETQRVESPDVRPVAEILARIQAELEEISRRIDHNQALIAQSMGQSKAQGTDYVAAVQDADLTAQRVAGLATYLREIAAMCSPRWAVDTASATATLTLAELARVMSVSQNVQNFATSADAGEVDLF